MIIDQKYKLHSIYRGVKIYKRVKGGCAGGAWMHDNLTQDTLKGVKATIDRDYFPVAETRKLRSVN